jgi:hypothetical protein
MPTLSERVAAPGRMRGLLCAAPKPWPDRKPAPWGNGDEDGEDHGSYRDEPGEEIREPPANSPDSDLDLRSALNAAAATSPDAEAVRAMQAIEARLGEITLFFRSAKAGAPPDLAFKLDVLAAIL